MMSALRRLALVGVAVTASAALGVTAQAAEPDPSAWALPDPAVAVVFRGADALADWVDETERRYGRSARVRAAVAALRGWETQGVAPARRVWGPGLALEHGAGIWIGADAQVRLVVGASDAEVARATLAKWAAALELPISATADGLVINARSVPCAARGRFLVCDTIGVPEAAPGGVKGYAPDRALEVVLGPQGVIMTGLDLPITGARFSVQAEGEHVRGRLDCDVAPHAREALAALGDPKGESRGLGTIDARSPAVLKLSVDAPRLFETFGEPGADDVGALTALVAGLRLDWRGDVVLSFAPSLLQPVFALGLRDGRDGSAIVDGLVVALANEAGVRALDLDGVLTLEAEADEGDAPFRLKVRHRVIDGALVFALSDVDLDRIAEGRVLPPTLPGDFADRGTHGVWVTGLSGLFGPRPPDLFETPEPALEALVDLVWLQIARLDGAAWVVRVTPEALTAELSWRLL